MNRNPLILRLTLAATLLPVFLAPVLVLIILLHTPASAWQYYEVLGISFFTGSILIYGIFPAIGLALVLLGSWRAGLLTGTLPMLFVFLILAFFVSVHMPEERRTFDFAAFPAGTDVWCNDHALGKTPLNLTVGDLTALVGEAAGPPAQPYLKRGHSMPGSFSLYSIMPWDRFIRERFEEKQLLDSRGSVDSFDGESRYWWRFEFHSTRSCLVEPASDYQSDYDAIDTYRFFDYCTVYYPSLRAHAELLIDGLDSLDPALKPHWDRQVVAFEKLLAPYLSARLAKERVQGYTSKDALKEASPLKSASLKSASLKSALRSTARLKYGLSDPPTPEECARAFQAMADEKILHVGFASPYSGTNLPMGSLQHSNDQLLFAIAVEEMGDACLEPIRHCLRHHVVRYDEQGRWKGFHSPEIVYPALYAAKVHGFPELYDELVAHFATAHEGFDAVMANRDPRVVGLLKTLLEPNRALDYTSKENLARAKAEAIAAVDSPLVEPMVRAYLEQWLPKMSSYDSWALRQVLGRFVAARLERENPDFEGLIGWIERLRVDREVKTYAISRIRVRMTPQERTLGDKLFANDAWTPETGTTGTDAPGKPEQDRKYFAITVAMLDDWLESHPGKTIEEFFVDYDGALVTSCAHLKTATISILCRDESPEAGNILERLWNDPVERDVLLDTLANDQAASFADWVNQRIISANTYDYTARAYGSLTLPGFYYDLKDMNVQTAAAEREKTVLSRKTVSLLAKLDDPKRCAGLVWLLQGIDREDAGALLKTWADSDYLVLKNLAASEYKAYEFHERIRLQCQTLLAQLLQGECGPDDLIPQPQPWVWEDGKYISQVKK